MSNGPWTDEENDLIVADYFAMLAEDMAGRPYNKAQHRRSLMPLLRSRRYSSKRFKSKRGWIVYQKKEIMFKLRLKIYDF